MRRGTMAAVGLLLCAGLALAAETSEKARGFDGDWSLNNWTPGSSVNLKLGYRNASTRWQWGSDQSLADLHGLTREQLHGAHVPVAFTLERDAGAFAFEGTVILGIGSGNYRFVPNPDYLAKLAALGFEGSDRDDVSLMMLAVRDVSLAYAAEVRRLGLRGASVQDLVRLRDHGVEPQYLARIQTAGFDGLTIEQVIKLHDHGVD